MISKWHLASSLMSMLSFRFLCLAIATSASDNHVSTTNPDHTKLFGSKLRKENAIWNSVRGMESSFVSDSDRHAPYQRRIQQQQQQNVSLNYWAKYTAQFQSREHIACESPPPALKVYCRGPDLQILAVSDPSIVCQSNGTADAAGRLPVNSDGFTHIECASTCASSTECANVHLILDGTTSNEDNSKNSTQKTSRRGPTGEIQFQCGGESLADVDAAVSLEQIGNGQCDKLEGVLEELAEKEEEKEEEKNESANAFRTTQIVQFLRLGVVCPLENTTVFDDFYFECTPDSLTYLDPYSNDNHYICAEARNCNGSSCTTNSSSLLLNSDSRQFRTCIESARPIPPPAASSAPAPPSNTDNNSEKVWILSAKFEASWSLLFDPLSADDCNAFTPTVRLECSNGNDIQFLDSTTNSVNCTALFNDSNAGRNSAMICIDTDSFNFVDKFTSITYECSGQGLPETNLGFLENDASCSNNRLDATVSHALQLGVYCGGDMSEFVFYGDLYFECVNTSPRFGFMDEFASPNGRRYTCMETVTFLVDDGMSPEQRSTQTIPFLAISTDSDWKNTPDENCYRRIETIRTPTPTLSPTKVPISTTTPVFLSAKLPLSLSETPVQPPASKILNAPVKTSSIRSETSTARQNDHLTSASNSIERSAILAAIAGMVSGVAIAGILVYLVVRRKKITQQTRLGSLDAEVTRGQSPIHEFTKSTSSGQLQGISGIDDTCASAIDHKVIHDSDIETADSSIREMVHTETDSTQSDESFHSHQTKELFQTSDTIPSPISNEASQSTDLQDRDINEVRRSSECGLKLMDDTQVDDHVDHLLKENDAGETSSPSMSTLSPPRREDPLLEEKNFQDLTRTVASEDQSNREADQVLDMSSLPPEASIETQSGFVEKIEETLIGTVPRVTTIPSHETDLLSHALSANVELLNSLITLEGCSCESTIEAQSPTVELPTHGDLIATDSAVNAMPSSSENDLS